MTRAAHLVFSLWLTASAVGCASYQTKVSGAREAMRSGSASQAAAQLEPLAQAEGNDQLVYLLDYATALQQAGRYKESAAAFDRAEQMADIKDYHSISRVTSSLLLSEEMVQYKGEDYEKVLINAVNSMNYLEMGELDEALVEVRKLNNKLYRFRTEAKRDYDQNPFAYYLSGVIWEADRKWDDAFISYKNAYDLMPEYAPLHEDLIRVAIKAGRDDVSDWKKKFPEVKVKPEWKDKSLGEIILVYQQGWGPRKGPRPENPRYPMLYRSPSETRSAKLIVNEPGRALSDDKSKNTDKDDNKGQIANSQMLFDISGTAIKTLDADYGRLVASRLTGIAAKAVVADQLRQRNEALGLVAWVVMNAADRADVRQWSTLPGSFQIARLPVKAGKYKVTVEGLNSAGFPTGEQMPEREIEVKAGKKAFVTWRSVR